MIDRLKHINQVAPHLLTYDEVDRLKNTGVSVDTPIKGHERSFSFFRHFKLLDFLRAVFRVKRKYTINKRTPEEILGIHQKKVA